MPIEPIPSSPTLVQGVADTLLPPPSTPGGVPPAAGDISAAVVTSVLVMLSAIGVAKDIPWLSALVAQPTFAAFVLGVVHLVATLIYQRFSGPRKVT